MLRCKKNNFKSNYLFFNLCNTNEYIITFDVEFHY